MSEVSYQGSYEDVPLAAQYTARDMLKGLKSRGWKTPAKMGIESADSVRGEGCDLQGCRDASKRPKVFPRRTVQISKGTGKKIYKLNVSKHMELQK